MQQFFKSQIYVRSKMMCGPEDGEALNWDD